VKILTLTLATVMLVGLALAALLSSCGGSAEVSLLTEKTFSEGTTAEVRVRSAAMEPTLHCAKGEGFGCEGDAADRLLVQVPARPIERGNIVAFKAPKLARSECGAGGVFIMRAVGLPGDVWKLRDGFSYVNRRKLEEPYVRPASRDSQSLTLADLPPRHTFTRIPPDRYLVMGDNRNSSCDSRWWGLVPRANIVGTVVQNLRPRH
jgi:signal peptidase I